MVSSVRRMNTVLHRLEVLMMCITLCRHERSRKQYFKGIVDTAQLQAKRGKSPLSGTPMEDFGQTSTAMLMLINPLETARVSMQLQIWTELAYHCIQYT